MMIITDTKGDHAVRERAYRLAESGEFAAVHDVEQALIGEGWPNVGAALHNDHARRAIAERCSAARAR